jgi:hypothetical protein
MSVRTAFFSFSSVFSWTSGAEINVSALNRISVFTDELIFLKLPSSYKPTKVEATRDRCYDF